MPDIIKLLPDGLANQIAAGEVIQRPASAVKELLENAIDAGANRVTLLVKDAGKALIQVSDNGKGMTPTDARMCFERHATSKINQIDDLFAINTFGFRGEAMASIAAVAQVVLRTCSQNADIGTELQLEGSVFLGQNPINHPVGTTIMVKNLFYNVPARRNFLKSNQVELRHIIDEFHRVALAYPAISFQITHNASILFDLKPANLRQRITQLLGEAYNQHIAPVKESASILAIDGFIGKPQIARKTRGDQYFFVNRRFIRDPYLNHAVVSAFEDLLPDGAYPFYVLNLDIDPRQIDINVHPTKTEIKFQDEKSIYAVLHAAIKRSLSQYQLSPSLDFETDSGFNQILPAEFRNDLPQVPQPNFNPNYNPFNTANKQTNNSLSGGGQLKRNTDNIQNWRSLFEIVSNRNQRDEAGLEPSNNLHNNEKAKPLPVVQIHNKYLMSTIKSGIMIVDQQAAHERILFEKLRKQLQGSGQNSQQSLFPEQLQLNASDALLLQSMLPDLQMLGFELSDFGNFTFLIQAAPFDVVLGKQVSTILGLIEQFKLNKSQLKLDRHDNIARSLAKQMAIGVGKALEVSEMQQLIDELFACEIPYYTPDGRQTLVTWSLEQIEQFFK